VLWHAYEPHGIEEQRNTIGPSDIGFLPVPRMIADHSAGDSCLGRIAYIVIDAVTAGEAGIAVPDVVGGKNAIRFKCRTL